MKRLLLVALAVISLALVLALVIFLVKEEQMSTEIKVIPSKTTVQVGEKFQLAVVVTPGVAEVVAGLQMDLNFNPESFKVDSVERGPLLGDQSVFNLGAINNAEGTVAPNWGAVTTPGQGITASGVFITFNCTALGAGKPSGLSLANIIVGNLEAVALPFELSIAQVAVLSPYDLDGSGSVDGSDMAIAAAQFGGSGSADFNIDGKVDVLDLIQIGQHYS